LTEALVVPLEMYDEILIPTDGSAGGASGVARALDLARTAGARVHVVSVVDTAAEPPAAPETDRAQFRDRMAARCQAAVDEIRSQAVDADIQVESGVLEGVPYRAIIDYIEQQEVDLVVMGTTGTSDGSRAKIGSTTQRVITLAGVPVLSVRRGRDEPAAFGVGTYDDVVIATDGSDESERAATHALAIAERYGADVHVIYVVDSTIFDLGDAPGSVVGLLKEGGRQAIDDIAATARERTLPVTTSILRGRPAGAIESYAGGVDADLIALGTRGRAALSDELLGSTTERLVRSSARPILTVS
jgi:nucleotide-binding universal stress UspA family protein